MAEAHQAVAFSFSITHEGWDINYDREVLELVFDSGIRSWKKKIARFRVSSPFLRETDFVCNICDKSKMHFENRLKTIQ